MELAINNSYCLRVRPMVKTQATVQQLSLESRYVHWTLMNRGESVIQAPPISVLFVSTDYDHDLNVTFIGDAPVFTLLSSLLQNPRKQQ